MNLIAVKRRKVEIVVEGSGLMIGSDAAISRRRIALKAVKLALAVLLLLDQLDVN